jgi:DNA repair exonuclease SbcCD nuclease subunit
VFGELYEAVKKSPENTVVVCCGDTFHSKVDLSPESIQMAYDLFTNIATHRPFIVIAGNHDTVLQNKNRLDSITPIVDALNNPSIYYLKETGLYGFGNILFNNMGVFDPPEKYIRGNDIPAIYRNQYEHVIALFHGPVDGASTDTGFRISNPSVMTPLFDNHDITMLGDIHLAQDMQDYDSSTQKPCVRFCGSCIQQNHGESLRGHGYTLWNLSSNTYTHHELKNNFGYFTIEIHKGQLTTDLSDLPPRARLRVRCYETIATEVKAVVAAVKAKTDVVEISYMRMDQDKIGRASCRERV